MAVLYPSDAWIRELMLIANADEEMHELGKHFSGKFVFQVEAEAGLLDRTVCLFCWPDGGQVKEAMEVASPEARPDADYVITGKYSVWKKVVRGEQEPLRALMTRKLKLVKGRQIKLLKEVKLALKIINLCTQVDAEFVDEKG